MALRGGRAGAKVKAMRWEKQRKFKPAVPLVVMANMNGMNWNRQIGYPPPKGDGLVLHMNNSNPWHIL